MLSLGGVAVGQGKSSRPTCVELSRLALTSRRHSIVGWQMREGAMGPGRARKMCTNGYEAVDRITMHAPRNDAAVRGIKTVTICGDTER
jgi:hypothetical protein